MSAAFKFDFPGTIFLQKILLATSLYISRSRHLHRDPITAESETNAFQKGSWREFLID